MGKHFVRTVGAAVLVAGSLVGIASSPAAAVNYFVHGNVTCKVEAAAVQYSPALRHLTAQTTKFRVKGTLGNCTDGAGNPGGETGRTGMVIQGGAFSAISDFFSGTCDTITPPSITMRIRWFANTGKVRDTNVSWVWNPGDSVQSSPYSYQFVGGTVQTLGVSGSYVGATAAASFFSSMDGSLACADSTLHEGRLKGGWTVDPTLSSTIVFQSPPSVSSVTPNQAVLGQQDLNIDVAGQDFAPGDTLAFSGGGITVNSTNFVSANEMTANISVDPNALAGTRDVTVTNATLGSSTCSGCFMVAPIVSGVSPATGGQGASSRNITITGQGFANGAVATFEPTGSTGPTTDVTTNYTQFIDANTLIANVNIAPAASLTTYDVTVTDPGFGVGVCAACFSVNSGPTVASTSPGARGGGATGQVIAINGTGFASDSTVAFGGTGITITNVSYVSPTQLLATINIATGSPNGPRSVTVMNSDGGQGGCAACFTVNKGPTVTLWQVTTLNPPHRINPNPDPIGRRDRDVVTVDITITGTNFQPGAQVSYPASAVTTLIVNSQIYLSTTKIKQNITIDYADFSQLQTSPPDRTVIVTNPDGGTFALPGAVILVG